MTTPAPASDADPAHYASYGTQEAQYGDFTTYADYDATGFVPPSGSGFDTGASTTSFESDPLFGCLPADGTGSYDMSLWSTGGHQTVHHDPYAARHHAAHDGGTYDSGTHGGGAYDSGTYDSTAWTGEHQHLSAIPPQATSPDTSGQWDANAWLQPDQSGAPADGTQQWEWGTQAFDTGAYDATQWNSDGPATAGDEDCEQRGEHAGGQETATFDHVGYGEHAPDDGESAATGEMPSLPDGTAASDTPLLDDQEELTPVPASRAAARGGSRSRRRLPAKRSALLTVAVPSACVMGVAGIAAASVTTLTSEDKDVSTTAADAAPVQPATANNKLDTQLQSLSAEADDFSDRVSRTQERIDLKAQQEAEKKKAAAEAARKERLRPKYALPVAQHGLSAYYGQSGINWMSIHTGIDFPVSYGTTVMAATDGTVRTQWNSAYGNMMIVTDKDGTETWYCHLSSYRVASGTTVKAGDPIAYAGNSGNSTGPHLHFEVRPAGGSAIDPLSWLRSHGVDPT
jgi:murein DD-endopeptidase MepM/ murein hydrolase activator NlpD